jgi:hypothetical protein
VLRDNNLATSSVAANGRRIMKAHGYLATVAAFGARILLSYFAAGYNAASIVAKKLRLKI